MNSPNFLRMKFFIYDQENYLTELISLPWRGEGKFVV